MDRIVERPETPPLTWLKENPSNFVEGQTLNVTTEGPDSGRIAGLIMPAEGSAAFMNKGPNHGTKVPDARSFPDNFRTFNRGPINALNEKGEVVTIQGGKLTIKGGHSQGKARGLKDSIDYLNREGRFEHLKSDVGMIGVARPVMAGAYAGAVQFNGVVAHGMTLAEAEDINATSVSAEIWKDPYYGGAQVFAGATRVDYTAWPYNVPMALAAEAEQQAFVVIREEGDDLPEPVQVIAAEHEPGHNKDLEDLKSRLESFEEAVGVELTELRIEIANPLDGMQLQQTVDQLKQQVKELLEEADKNKQTESEETNQNKSSVFVS